jgi:hypothetical protein
MKEKGENTIKKNRNIFFFVFVFLCFCVFLFFYKISQSPNYSSIIWD